MNCGQYENGSDASETAVLALELNKTKITYRALNKRKSGIRSSKKKQKKTLAYLFSFTLRNREKSLNIDIIM